MNLKRVLRKQFFLDFEDISAIPVIVVVVIIAVIGGCY